METVYKKYKNGLTLELIEYYDEFKLNGWYSNSEIESQDWIIDNVQEGWKCFDVGSHIGYYSMLLAYMSQKVIAFDPCYETTLMMDANLKHNIGNSLLRLRSNTDIDIVNVAVGDVIGKFTDTVWQTGKTEGDYGKTTQEFNFISLDYYCAIHRVNRLDFIKIDTDGYDFDVIRGAYNSIMKFRPSIIMEINVLHWRGTSSEMYFNYVDKIGYDYKQIDGINMLLTPRKQ